MEQVYKEQLIEHRRALHKIPEISYQEHKTKKYLLTNLTKLEKFTIQEIAPTGILAIYNHDTSSDEYLCLRADMDGLPVLEKTSYDFSSVHQGFMHACGHDFHMSILLTFAEYLNNNDIKKNIVLIFQPAEEGKGGAISILDSQEFQSLKIREVYALHNSMDYPVGSVAFNNHKMFAGTLEIKVKFLGKGGHSAYYHRMNDLNTVASMFNLMLNSIPSRMINPIHETIVSTGQFMGVKEAVCNILPSEFNTKVTVRSYDQHDLTFIKKKVEDMCKAVSLAYDINYEYEVMSEYAPVINNPKIAAKLKEKLTKDDILNYIECEATMTGEDFGFFTSNYPGMIIWLGAGYEEGGKNKNLHTAEYCPREEALSLGLELFKKIIEL